jgi:hypothetical protein
MLRNNYFIINKKARVFSGIKIAGKTAVFLDSAGRPADFGVLPLGDSVYAMLSCDEVKLLMIVTDRQGVHDVIGVFWKDEEDFESECPRLGNAAGMKIYRRDLKINSYAWSIAGKLDEGVRIRVAEAVDESDMTECPDCGMLNPKGTPYCLECGCELE